MDDKKMVDEQLQSAPTGMTPGQTISPRQESVQAAPEAPTLPSAETAQTPPPPQPAEETTETAAEPSEEAIPEEENFQDEQSEPDIDQIPPVSWTASEYISHHKTGGWYAVLILGAVVLAALVYVFTRDWLSTGVVVVAGAVLAGYSMRKPRQQTYEVGPSGLTIGPKFFAYSDFRSFSIVPEGAFASIVFMPLKRFGVQTTIYYDPKDEDRILDVISLHLPHEEHNSDMLDHMMRRIRF